MRHLTFFLIPLLLVFKTSAQKTFSQKDFNKLKQLQGSWILMIREQDGISEIWFSDKDTLLTGTLYHQDSVKLPIANMKLHYNNGTIKMEHTYLDKNGTEGSVHSLVLQNIDSGIYYFRNTADITLKNLKEIYCSTVSYDLSFKKSIKIERKLILPVKGLITVKYTCIKNE